MTDYDPREYYYVHYMGLQLGGAIVLPQSKGPDGKTSVDGFNVTEATELLHKVVGPVVIMNWRKITKKRFDEFNAFVAKVTGATPETKKRPSHLSLVKLEENKNNEPQ